MQTTQNKSHSITCAEIILAELKRGIPNTFCDEITAMKHLQSIRAIGGKVALHHPQVGKYQIVLSK